MFEYIFNREFPEFTPDARELHDFLKNDFPVIGITLSGVMAKVETDRELNQEEQLLLAEKIDQYDPDPEYANKKNSAYLSKVEQEIDDIANLSQAKVFIKKLVRYLLKSDTL